jgi:pimeloyl-ACP methyl ester carboxylesterase
MKRRTKRFYMVLSGIFVLTITAFASMSSEYEAVSTDIRIETFEVLDSVRNRLVPYALYSPVSEGKVKDSIRLVIFSHGYGSNYSRNYLNYSYLTKRLARSGFWTVSIQHELLGDPLIPKEGIMQVVRMPFWIRGKENILFVLNDFKKKFPELKIRSIDLIGHSNGGDMSILTAKDHPELIRKVITLDHLRMPVPHVLKPQFSSLRSTDKTADSLVIPSKDDCQKYGIQIVQLKKITHNEMNDEGSRKQKKQINSYIQKILEDRF